MTTETPTDAILRLAAQILINLNEGCPIQPRSPIHNQLGDAFAARQFDETEKLMARAENGGNG